MLFFLDILAALRPLLLELPLVLALGLSLLFGLTLGPLTLLDHGVSSRIAAKPLPGFAARNLEDNG